MDIISRSCGVILDKDMLTFPDIEEIDGESSDRVWMDRRFVAVVPCPVCGGPVPEEGEIEKNT